ncbi:MAG TPA: hypothetical protein PKN95_04400 [Verrucomicrobiota bacterium]|nr:hypothetical protein [Verrucomicrobiota bacterium]HNT14894.1 hypothetical protein [Verrucomicrobiota bacterium]
MNCLPHPAGLLKRGPRAPGLALIELLVTVVILLLLFTMFFGAGTSSRRTEARLRCQGNLQKTFVALQLFANDHDGWFPQATNATGAGMALVALVPRYTADPTILVCPGRTETAPAPDRVLREGRISYSYYQGHRQTAPAGFLLTDWQVNTRAKRVGDLLFSETGEKPGNNHAKDGGNLLGFTGDTLTSPPRAAVDLPLAAGVVLLNPNP